jgi:hypothetical protein
MVPRIILIWVPILLVVVPLAIFVKPVVLAVLREVSLFLLITLITVFEACIFFFMATVVAILPRPHLLFFPIFLSEEWLHHSFIHFVVLDIFNWLIILIIADILVGNATFTGLLGEALLVVGMKD